MKKQYIIAVIAVLILAGVGWVLIHKNASEKKISGLDRRNSAKGLPFSDPLPINEEVRLENKSLGTNVNTSLVLSSLLALKTDTSAWQIYKNEKYGYEFKYPQGFVVKNYGDGNFLISSTSVPNALFISGYVFGRTDTESEARARIYSSSGYLNIASSSSQSFADKKITYTIMSASNYERRDVFYVFSHNNLFSLAVSNADDRIIAGILQSLVMAEKKLPENHQIYIEYSSELLGFSFRYPESWGVVETREETSTSYLFGPPDALKSVFIKAGWKEDDLTTAHHKEQIAFLKKDERYKNYLSKKLTLSFSKNQNLNITAFNEQYLDMSGYEAAAPITPVFLGNIPIAKESCLLPKLYSQIKIKNFYLSDCKILPNSLLSIFGTYTSSDSGDPNNETASVIVIGELTKSKFYNGLLIEYRYKNYINQGAQLMKLFGYTGYGERGRADTIEKINIRACNAIEKGSGSAGSSFSGDTANVFALMGISPGIASLVERAQHIKTVSYNVNGSLVEETNTIDDIKRNIDKFGIEDINCALYKIYRKENLDDFMRAVKGDNFLLEFQDFLGNIIL
ncbi:MAG: hypothetical protein WCT49_00025 [Candidatus Paceibacterota bacterium]|jgi:hypothetical protein|nr:hypothetical protein [Candidatus Paceibacterota bacterium]